MQGYFLMSKIGADIQRVGLLNQDMFSAACAALPLISIDLMVTRPGLQGRELLLGLRKNRPAKGWWFTPGGRIYKNEPFNVAMRRIAQQEIGLNFVWLNRAKSLGIKDHFYPDSAFNPNISTHYLNLPYALALQSEEAQTLKLQTDKFSQHEAWQWISIELAQNDPNVHSYVRAVLKSL